MRYYIFSVVSKTQSTARDRIAKRHGSDGAFIAANLPEGPRYWLAIPSFGEPFTPPTSAAIQGDAKAAGLWPLKK